MEGQARATMPQALERSLALKAELERVRSVLAGMPQVKQTLVFGSVSTERVHEWSDLDLVIIEETSAPFIERGAELARLVRPRLGVQFLVYTPQELSELSHKPFFRAEILEKGKVLPMNPEQDAQRWLAFAEEDLRVAELAMQEGIFNQTCFHAQQAVEKCLKASLAAAGELLPRTHLVADLLALLPSSGKSLLRDLERELLVLDQFYIPTRYPDALPGTLPEGLPQGTHAEQALAVARRCYELISSQTPRERS